MTAAKMKIHLPIFETIPRAFTKCVVGEIVDIAPHLSLTFAVHRDPFVAPPHNWKVSNVETGCCVGEWFNAVSSYRHEAIEFARSRCATHTEQSAQTRLRKLVREFPEVTK